MDTKDAIYWLVLDNVANGLAYTTNLHAGAAEFAYIACVRDGLICDGNITSAGRAVLDPGAEDVVRAPLMGA